MTSELSKPFLQFLQKDDVVIRNALFGGYSRAMIPIIHDLLAYKKRRNRNYQGLLVMLLSWAVAYGEFEMARNLFEQYTLKKTPRLKIFEALTCFGVGNIDAATDILSDLNDQKTASLRDFLIAKSYFISGDVDNGLAMFNKVYQENGLAEIFVDRQAASTTADLFTKLASDTDKVVHGELVSIIVPAFNAEATIGTALNGLRAQTYVDIEVIVVDDSSSDMTADIVESVADQDDRIKLVRMKKNGGPYSAQNKGLLAASGRYVRTHGADDWLHPQCVELHAKEMEKSELKHSISMAVGVTKELEPTPLPGGSALFVRNMSSYTFDRNIALQLGGWDNVRYSGDGEFYFRMCKYLNDTPDTIAEGIPLSLLLSSKNSLSGQSTIGRESMRYGSRWEYRQSYEHWHAKTKDLKIAARAGSKTQRRFAAPLTVSGEDEPKSVNEILVADFSDLRYETSILNWLSTAKHNDAILHYPYITKAQKSFTESIRAAAAQKFVRTIVPGERVECSTLTFIHPYLLEYSPNNLPVLICKTGRFLENPSEMQHVNREYAINQFSRLFGVKPQMT